VTDPRLVPTEKGSEVDKAGDQPPVTSTPGWKRFSVLSPARLAGFREEHIPPESTRATHPLIRTLPALSGFVVLLVSAVVLLGWAFDIPTAKTLLFGSVTVKANTAIGLGLGAVCLLLYSRIVSRSRWRRPLVSVLSLLVAAIGVLTLLEYVFGVNARIDELVFDAKEDWGRTATPGRMAAVTASAFMLLGGGLLTLDIRTKSGRRASIVPLVATVALGLTALLGYVYGAIPTAGLGQGIQIAIPTAICFILLSVGALAIPPHGPWVATLLSDHAGGLLARRLLPIAFLVPLALGGLRVFGDWTGQYSLATQSAFSAVLTMLAFGIVIWSTAALLDAADRQRHAAEAERLSLAVKEEASRARADAERASRYAAESAREQAERATKEKAEALTVLEIVLATAPVGFALFDRDARYIRVNSTFAAMHDVPLEGHIGRPPQDFSPDLAGRIEESVREVFKTGKPILETKLTRDLTGAIGESPRNQRHIMVSYYPLRGADGKPFAVGLVAVDTTELKQLEAQLAQSQKMEAIGQLAGGVAHDFNNLLTVIMSYSALLLDDFDAGDSRRLDIEEIAAAAHRASGLTRQLLAFSRKQVVQPRPTNVNDVIRNVENMLRRLIGEDIKFESTLAPDVGLVNIDPGQLEQVLLNLAVNARDAMPEGGTLQIITANIELGAAETGRQLSAPPGPYVLLSVNDTGAGIPPDVQKRVFEPFFTTKPTGKGTGLGLSTVYGIVKQLGGDLWLRSEPGKGTTFHVYVPRIQGESPEAIQRAKPVALPAGSGTVLLAEDDHALRALTERVLLSAGFTVLPARSGSHALEIARNHAGRIDLAISDVVMPELSGPEFVERLRRKRPGVRVLFVSGYTDDEVMRRGVLAGETAFLQKPFAPEQLLQKIREVMSGGGEAG
jgi:signal transduction histidine kinase/ActR/RegA family two-component response regulator